MYSYAKYKLKKICGITTIKLCCFARNCPTVCVTCVWAGVDSAWEQENAEARKMLENAAESHTSGARFVGTLFALRRL